MEAAHDVKPQLGQVMLDHGLITPEQLEQALAEQQRLGRPLGKLLVELGFVSTGAVANALAQQHGGLLKTEFGISAGLAPVAHAPARAAEPAAAPPPDDGRLRELEAQLEQLEGERTALHDHVREVRAFAERAVEAEALAQARLQEVENALELARPKLAQLTAEVESLQGRLAEAESRAADPAREDALLANLAELEGELAAARSRIAELEAATPEPSEPDDSHAELSAQIEALREQLADAESRAADRAEEDALRAGLAALEGDLVAARVRIAELEAAPPAAPEPSDAQIVAELAELRGVLGAAVEALVAPPLASPAVDEPQREPDRAHLLFVPSPSGYALVEREGPPPASGAVVEVDGTDFRVARVGGAPFPGRDLRCAFLLRV